MDKQLNDLRRRRWERAFSEHSKDESQKDINLRATIVIEHIIQASDVSHTMQHWHVYRKWNERLFDEVYRAYSQGRIDKDPSQGWYQGELGFFDFYIVSHWSGVVLHSTAHTSHSDFLCLDSTSKKAEGVWCFWSERWWILELCTPKSCRMGGKGWDDSRWHATKI